MTLLSRRKRRTTARPTTPGTRAASAALLLALVAVPAPAQPPGPPAANPVQPNGLALPPGYRPRTPPSPGGPSAAQPRPAATAGSAGTVMYFQKPADALTATGGGLPADGVAQLGGREPAGRPVPDVAPVATAPPRPPAAPAAFAVQPEPVAVQPGDTSTSQKRLQDVAQPIDPREIQLPPREKIFGVVYNDPALERAVMESVVANLRRAKVAEPDPKTLVFPALPEVSPPGVAYQPKTGGYEPRKLLVEPGYVVHRRLHFEQRNFERAGWDLGPLTTLLSAGRFYRDALLWPASLVSGCTYGFWDTSAGKCLPGSPTPLYLYPPNLTCGGVLAEAGLITGFSFLFP